MILTRFIPAGSSTIWGSKNTAPSLRSRAIRTPPISSITISSYPTTFNITLISTSHLLRSAQIWNLLNANSFSGSYQPARYFSKGIRNPDPQKNRPPIPYLLTETNEHLIAKWPPGSPSLLRSICRGKGILKQNEHGIIYLQIDTHFINAQFPFLQRTHNLSQAPYFDPLSDPKGAHIPVISERESLFHYLTEIPEIGKEFSFEVEGLYAVNPTFWEEAEQVWFLRVTSPDLETLRRKHFLPEKMGGHSFHMVLATKPKQKAPENLSTPHPIMRINIAFLAA